MVTSPFNYGSNHAAGSNVRTTDLFATTSVGAIYLERQGWIEPTIHMFQKHLMLGLCLVSMS